MVIFFPSPRCSGRRGGAITRQGFSRSLPSLSLHPARALHRKNPEERFRHQQPATPSKVSKIIQPPGLFLSHLFPPIAPNFSLSTARKTHCTPDHPPPISSLRTRNVTSLPLPPGLVIYKKERHLWVCFPTPLILSPPIKLPYASCFPLKLTRHIVPEQRVIPTARQP